MKKIELITELLLVVLQFEVMGITPEHVGHFTIDTSLYVCNLPYGCTVVPGPYTEMQSDIKFGAGGMYVFPYLKKNSDQFDFYSYSGKVGTARVPVMESGCMISFSCTMLDNDAGWEAIVNYTKESNTGEKSILYFKVFDDDGTELLTDSGYAYYGADFNNTYVVSFKANYSRDSWRFRTNISAESPKSLAKTKSIQSSPMQIYGLPGGDYRVTLTPSSGNQINFQMFDLLGRCVFDKQIGNLNRPVSFTVPEGNVPNSPFIAKVNDGNNSVVKKQIPVK